MCTCNPEFELLLHHSNTFTYTCMMRVGMRAILWDIRN